MIHNDLKMLASTLMKIFVYSGRATRKEFWTFLIVSWVIQFLVALLAAVLANGSEITAIIGAVLVLIVTVYLTLATISLTVRRLHDISLSGFWLLYLNPMFGLPLLYTIYLMGIDSTCQKIIDNNSKIGSCWLGWILTFLFWSIGSVVALFLLFLFPGKKEDNEFGANPYAAN